MDTIWVCTACGKAEKNRYDMNDASCFMNAVECDEASLKYNEHGRVTYAVAIENMEES